MGVALVTGGSRGLGAEISKALAAAGWPVAVNYAANQVAAHEVVTAIEAAGGRAIAVRFDVTHPLRIREGLAEIDAQLGPVGLVVNSAAGPRPVLTIEQQSWDDYLDQLNLFAKAPLLMLQAVLPEWRRQRTGRIINIGSEMAWSGEAPFAPYAAAKAAMIGLTRAWATELGPDGITVNLVAPGWPASETNEPENREVLETYRRQVPLGRLGQASDVAAAVVFLASPQAGFITGQTLSVNGGRTFG